MMSVRRSAATFGAATVLGHLSQLLWLVAGIRIMSPADFGTVLAAQALYGVLQIVVDIGTNAVGARMAARGELDDERRGQILRMRLLLALAVMPMAVVLGALNVSGSLAATLPFVLALGLFALLNVWEPYGRGDARPWATYMFARSGALAVVAGGFLVVDATFPLELAGLLECVAIVVVMVAFERAPLRGLRPALRVRGGEWRSVFLIGWPAFATQSSMAAGTLALSGSGSPATAGVFAACVRLLSGINAINGIVATSLYPRLARGAAEGAAADRHVVRTALGLIALLGAGATAVCVLMGDPIAVAFFGESSSERRAALALTMAAALALGNIFMFTYQMYARGREGATLLPFALGAPLTVLLAIGAVAVEGERVDLVAGSLLLGQLVTMAVLGRRVGAGEPDVAGATNRAMAIAAFVAVVAGISLVDRTALLAGIALLALSAALVVGLRPLWRTLLADVGNGGRARARQDADDQAP
jgi:O-antigen/teichoic acid export membrane protein